MTAPVIVIENLLARLDTEPSDKTVRAVRRAVARYLDEMARTRTGYTAAADANALRHAAQLVRDANPRWQEPDRG